MESMQDRTDIPEDPPGFNIHKNDAGEYDWTRISDGKSRGGFPSKRACVDDALSVGREDQGDD